MKVRNFTYNGFCGELTGGFAAYTAEFLRWTDDPGVALCGCSDGQERLIPTFALEGDLGGLPPQPRTGALFGPACASGDA